MGARGRDWTLDGEFVEGRAGEAPGGGCLLLGLLVLGLLGGLVEGLLRLLLLLGGLLLLLLDGDGRVELLLELEQLVLDGRVALLEALGRRRASARASRTRP